MSNRVVVALLLAVVASDAVHAQGRGGRGGAAAPAAPPQTARAAAPSRDLTGYWVSVVAEHWHLRMLVPPKGDFSMLPLNAEARRIADTWDPTKEAASGEEQCKSYGAAAIMRVPGRLHIQWMDDNTLKMDIDSGTQTRLLHFGGAPTANQPRDWQGYSVANWQQEGRGEIRHLRVITTNMRAGYLRKNGVPYSESARLEEHFDRFTEPNGDEWLVVDSIVTDPTYLTQPYLTSESFKKIADASGWDPTPCRADQPR